MMLPLIAMLICPGQTTLEAQACATQNVEQSDAKLNAILGDRTFSAWNKHRDRFCSLAKESLKDGSIHGQVLLGCFQQFNQLLLNEFRSLADPPPMQNRAAGEWVHCIIKRESGHQFDGGCMVQPFAGDGSFHLRNAFHDVDLIPGINRLTIRVTEPGKAWLTVQGLNLDQSPGETRSPAERRDDDKTCWITRGLSVCIN